MILELVGAPYEYKIRSIIKLFFPREKLLLKAPNANNKEDYISVTIKKGGAEENIFCVSTNINGCINNKEIRETAKTNKEKEWIISRLLYKVLAIACKEEPPWGVLTGVRPVKLISDLYSKGKTHKEITEIFSSEYLVSDEKMALAFKTYETQSKILSEVKEDSCSLYISIPFCPTRCFYCSFVSHAIENTHKLMYDYTDLLVKELAETSILVKDLGLKLQSVYIGGGTPTQLPLSQLEKILKAVDKYFDLSHLKEYTVEAGRPDTITKENLKAIYLSGAGRISINPQTLSQNVLDIIGRKHSVKEFYTAFNLARQVGFNIINTDLIAGLPSEDGASFIDGVNKIVELSPENITIHTLTIKRSSEYSTKEDTDHGGGLPLRQVLQDARKILTDTDYNPYYLYRQKGTKGGHENIGFSKKGTESYYNIGMMGDVQTVIGVGAGSASKVVFPNSKIHRFYNYKYPYEYIDDFSKTQNNKQEIRRLYESNR